VNDAEWSRLDVEPNPDLAKALALDSVTLAEPPRFPVDKLVGPIRDFVNFTVTDGLHPEATGPSAIVAVSALLSGVSHSQPPRVVPSVWVALTGVRSSGKSPAMRMALQELTEVGFNEAPILLTDSTSAAVPQELFEAGGSITIYCDELMSLLSGFTGTGVGGDSQSAGADLAFYRACWTGAFIRRTRISTGTIIIPSPRMSIVGGLLPGRTAMLGSVRDGDTARWLPALIPSTTPVAPAFQENAPSSWLDLLYRLREIRGATRQWYITGPGRGVYDQWRKEWGKRQYTDVPEHVSAGLSKAADQCVRLALVFAESLYPGKGGEVPLEAVEAACHVTEFHMQSWSAMLPPGISALDYASGDRAMAMAVLELTELICQLTPDDEDKVRRITQRQLLQRNACRIRNAEQMTKLLKAYESQNPGCVLREDVRGGRERVTVREPFRKPCE
jgi:hypothetical protein